MRKANPFHFLCCFFCRAVIPSLIICICVFPFNIGFSQENQNRTYDDRRVEVLIKFFNKQVYRVGDDIWIEVNVINHDVQPYTFITSFKKPFTFDFTIRSFSNIPIEKTKDYNVTIHQFEPVHSNTVILNQYDVYGVRINIAEWFKLETPGEYRIDGYFYPYLKTEFDDQTVVNIQDRYEDTVIHSKNWLKLNLKEKLTEESSMLAREEALRKLEAQSLAPYEVVRVMLEALQQEEPDFEVYFLYIDFDRFILQFQNARRLFQDAADRDKPAVIENEFKPYLRGENELEETPFIEHIPREFEIVKTVIERNDAEVEVIEEFVYGSLERKKRYTYYLHKFEDKWFLQKYEVVNLP